MAWWVSRVPSMTDLIFDKKVTSFPSKKFKPWDYNIPRIAWNSSWYSELTLRIAESISGDNFFNNSSSPIFLLKFINYDRHAEAVAWEPFSTPDLRTAE